MACVGATQISITKLRYIRQTKQATQRLYIVVVFVGRKSNIISQSPQKQKQQKRMRQKSDAEYVEAEKRCNNNCTNSVCLVIGKECNLSQSIISVKVQKICLMIPGAVWEI